MADTGAAIGTVTDVASLALSISEAMTPDKGFAYNLCSFQIDLRSDAAREESKAKTATLATPSFEAQGVSASIAAPTSTGKRPRAQAKLVPAIGPVIFVVESGSRYLPNRERRVEIGIEEVLGPDRIAGVVVLRELSGFDTSIGHTLAIEVIAQEQEIVPKGVLLVVKGLFNPVSMPFVAGGFAHFVGAVVIRAQQTNWGTHQLVCEPQFITQAPPRGYAPAVPSVRIEAAVHEDYLGVWYSY